MKRNCMSNFVKVVLILVATNMLAACGDGSSRTTDRGVPVYRYGSRNEALEASRDWRVSCTNPGKCPSTVAQMIVGVGSELGVCTATLIDNQTAITNSHCFDLTEKPVDPQAICKSGAVLVFASNSAKGREVVECDSVIAKSNIKGSGFFSPDYMILKLKRPLNRGHESFDFQGMEDGMKLEVRKVNPYGRGYGSLVVESCRTLHGTFFVPSAKSALAPVHLQSECKVVSGNSGSSLFDENGKIRGLIFAAVMDDKLSNFSGTFTPESIERLRRKKISYSTNAACISGLPDHQVPRRCSVGRTSEENKTGYDVDPAISLGRIESEGRHFQGDPRVGYEVKRGKSRETGTFMLVSRPSCYRSDSQLEMETFISLPVLKWTVQNQIDERLRLSLDIRRSTGFCAYSVRRGKGRLVVVSSPQPECQDFGAQSYLPEENWSYCH